MINNYLIPVLFGLAVLIQLIYLLIVFTSLLRHYDVDADQLEGQWPGVSIVVAAWNELDNLKELLPLLDQQEYPDFEVILIDDRSSDGTYDYLRTNEGQYKHVKMVHVNALPEHFTAKKYAVTMGIKKASKELILLTDADCRPTTQWVKQMVAQLDEHTEVVLGVSPYTAEEGRLNKFIRYETFQTALQYLSFAKIGIPFMGVGRNLLYRKNSFWRIGGFTTHLNLLSGDDDLFVNELARKDNTKICIDPVAQVYSEPKHTFDEWVIQKRRHLSVGKRYKRRDQISIGLLWMSLLSVWLLLIPAFFAEPSWFQLVDWLRVPSTFLDQYGLQHYLPYTNWMRVVTCTFLGWVLIRWLILYYTNKKLGRMVTSKSLVYLDFLYFVYLIVFGVLTLVSNPQKIKWR